MILITDQSVIDIVNLRNCISELSKSWHDVNNNKIKKCVSKVEIKSTPPGEDSEKENKLPISERKNVQSSKNMEQFVKVLDYQHYLEINNYMNR